MNIGAKFFATVFLALSTKVSAEIWKRHTIDNSSRGADGVRLADVNGDKLPDIATGWEEGGMVRVYLNPGAKKAKSPWPSVTVGKVASPEDAVFVDLDGDGAIDVVSCCEGATRSVFVHWAPKDKGDYLDAKKWKTSPVPAVEKKQQWMFAEPAQINGAGGIDLFLGSKGKNASVGWLEAPENPRDLAAWKFHKIRDAGWIMSLRAMDHDSDGNPDLLFSDRKGKNTGVFFLRNPGENQAAARKAWSEVPVGALGTETMFLNLGTAPGEILSTTRNGSFFVMKKLPGPDPWKWKEKKWPLPFSQKHGKAIAAGDIDLDGEPEIVLNNRPLKAKTEPCVALLDDDNAKNTWIATDIGGPEGSKFDRIELVDLDADGDLDLLTCEESANLGVIWFENPTR